MIARLFAAIRAAIAPPPPRRKRAPRRPPPPLVFRSRRFEGGNNAEI